MNFTKENRESFHPRKAANKRSALYGRNTFVSRVPSTAPRSRSMLPTSTISRNSRGDHCLIASMLLVLCICEFSVQYLENSIFCSRPWSWKKLVIILVAISITAAFVGAEIRVRRWRHPNTDSKATSIEVLPVPGGPCTNRTCGFGSIVRRPATTLRRAFACEALSPMDVQ